MPQVKIREAMEMMKLSSRRLPSSSATGRW